MSFLYSPTSTISDELSSGEKGYPLDMVASSRPRQYAVRPSAFVLLILVAFSLITTCLFFFFNFGPPTPTRPEHCLPCNPHDALCDKWGSQVILRSREYEGSGYQLQPLIAKARTAGRVVTIGIIGGSISACTDSGREDCYVSVLERSLRTLFAQHGSEVLIVNGAVPAAGSSYFSSCWQSQFTTDLDAIIIEAAVNDVLSGKNNADMDTLVKSILAEPNAPALLFLNMWSPTQMWNNGAPSINSLAQYYDIPVLSQRNVVYQHRKLHTSISEIQPWFARGPSDDIVTFPTGHHPGKLGHELTADIVTSFFTEQLCKAPFVGATLSAPGMMGLDLPTSPSPWSPYQNIGEAPQAPAATKKCYGPREGPLHFPLNVEASVGFVMARWKTKHFLAGYQPGDKAVFDIDLGASQRVAVLAWMGSDIGLGRAKMYFVGEKDSFVYIFGDNPPGQNLGNRSVRINLDSKLPPGPRQLVVEIIEGTGQVGKHEMRISAVVT